MNRIYKQFSHYVFNMIFFLIQAIDWVIMGLKCMYVCIYNKVQDSLLNPWIFFTSYFRFYETVYNRKIIQFYLSGKYKERAKIVRHHSGNTNWYIEISWHFFICIFKYFRQSKKEGFSPRNYESHKYSSFNSRRALLY